MDQQVAVRIYWEYDDASAIFANVQIFVNQIQLNGGNSRVLGNIPAHHFYRALLEWFKIHGLATADTPHLLSEALRIDRIHRVGEFQYADILVVANMSSLLAQQV